MKNVKLESLEFILRKELRGEVPVAFSNSIFVLPRKKHTTYISIKAYQTTHFEKFETDSIGYFKPISKCFLPEFVNHNSNGEK